MTDLIGVYADLSKDKEKDKDLYDYPSWWYSSMSRLPSFSGSANYRISMPRTRYHRRSYYAWLKHVDIPRANWVFITLTLKRDMSLFVAWLLIGFFISLFLNRMRNFFRKRGSKITYFWTIEPHEDGYPHVHMLISFPFISLAQIVKWWRDANKNPLSEIQGVDIKFIGNNPQAVRDYLVKYLVKSHPQLFSFQPLRRPSLSSTSIPVIVRLSTLLIWFYAVRLYGSSRNFFKVVRPLSQSFTLQGFFPLLHLYHRRYAPLGIDFSEFLLGMYYTETLDLLPEDFHSLLGYHEDADLHF